MTRDLNPATQSAASATAIHPVLFAKLEFDEGDVLAHTELGELSFGGDTYLGVGQFGGIGSASEVSDLSSSPITLTLSNIPGDMGAVVLGQIPGTRDVLGVLLVMIGVAVHQPVAEPRGRAVNEA